MACVLMSVLMNRDLELVQSSKVSTFSLVVARLVYLIDVELLIVVFNACGSKARKRFINSSCTI